MTRLNNELRELTIDEMDAVCGGKATCTEINRSTTSIITAVGTLTFQSTYCDGQVVGTTITWKPGPP
jgi:hypothetical protein